MALVDGVFQIGGASLRGGLPLRGDQDVRAHEEQSDPEVQDEVPRAELGAYEESLRRRGDITIWFDEAAVAAWAAKPSGRPGGQLQYSDLAVNTALTLRSVFHLALR